MSFLNRSVLQERAAAATVEKHPLLKECDVPPNVKQAYLQGCVLAVLEREDGKVTDAARQELLKLSKSLELGESETDEAIGVVSNLTSTEDQSDFLKELTATLSTEVYQRFFMADFERLIKKDGALSADATETVDYIGRTLTQEKSWRTALRTKKTKDDAAHSDVAGTGSDVDHGLDHGGGRGAASCVREGFLSMVSNIRVGCGTLKDYANLSNEAGKIAVRIIKPKNARMIRPALDEALLDYVSYGDNLFYVSREEEPGANTLSSDELVRQGHAYLNGVGVPVDLRKAFRAFGRAAKMGSAEGLNMLGRCYLKGWGVEANEQKAFQYCKKSADLGDMHAQYNVGSLYRNGQGCTADIFAAAKMYRAAAVQGLADAQNALGICYFNGTGVAQDFNEAVAWCKKAASQEHSYATWNMATFYMRGQGVPKDAEQAKWWAQKAAALGNEDAKIYLRERQAKLQQSVTYSREPPRNEVGEFWHDNSDTITNGLKVAGNLLLRGLFGG